MGFKTAMAFTEFHEGGFVDDPDDMGGTTIYGISKRAHPDPDFWRNPTPAKARVIYKREYWSRNKLYLLPPHIATIAFDLFVNHRPKDAVKTLQRGAGKLKIDGQLGPKTRARLRQNVNVSRILQWRMNLYGKIVRRKPEQAKFFNGWAYRTQCLSRYSLGVQAEIAVLPNGELSALSED